MTRPKPIQRQIPGETWFNLIVDDDALDTADWIKREEEFSDTHRWGNWYHVVVEYVPDGTFWSGMYKTGGDNDGLRDVNDFNDTFTLTRVSREPKTVWEWKAMYERSD